MDRRGFIAASGLGFLAGPGPVFARPNDRKSGTTVGDVNRHLRSLVEVEEPSVDRIVLGDPTARVSGIATAWMPTRRVCETALAQGLNVIVAHEPTFFTHWDLDAGPADDYLGAPEAARSAYIDARDRKREWLIERGVNIVRCHDVIDRHPEIGVPVAFAEALGLARGRLAAERGYYRVYEVDEVPARDLVLGIARRLLRFGQDGVAFYGDPEFRVRRVGLGTGYASNPFDYMDLGADLFVTIDDTIRTWVQPVFADDTGRPLVVVNHGTAEEPAMARLAEHLGAVYADVPVKHVGTGCGYSWIPARP